MNNLISVACGKGQVSHIKAAINLGYEIVGIDKECCRTEVSQHLKESTYDTKACLNSVRKAGLKGVAGVICRASGPALSTANELAKQFSLPRCGDLIASSSVSKLDLFKNASMLSILATETDAIESGWSPKEKMILKPDIGVDGKKDVYVIDSESKDLVEKIENAKNRSVNNIAVVSPFIEGRDIGLATLSIEGECLWQCFYEEMIEWSRETIINSNMKLDPVDINEGAENLMMLVARKFLEASKASGFVYFSFRLSQDNAYLYEVNHGLAGDGLVESLFKVKYPAADFFTLDILAMTGNLSMAQMLTSGVI